LYEESATAVPPTAAPVANACSSGVQAENISAEESAAITPIFLNFFIIYISFLLEISFCMKFSQKV